MKKHFKKSIIAILIPALMPLFAQASNSINIDSDGSFDISSSQTDGSEWLNNTNINIVSMDSSTPLNYIGDFISTDTTTGSNINENNVVVANGTPSNLNRIYGGYCRHSANNCHVLNTAVILNKSRGHVIYGAFANDDNPVNAVGNVYLNSASAYEIYGAFADTPSDVDASATAIGGVYLNNSTFSSSIIGAHAAAGSEEDFSATATAIGQVYLKNSSGRGIIFGVSASSQGTYSNNLTTKITAVGNVYIDNSRIDGSISGVYASAASNDSYTNATGSVFIYGDSKLQRDYDDGSVNYNTTLTAVDFYPSDFKYYDVFTGNTLSIANAPLTVAIVDSFENYRFYLNDYNKHVVGSNTALLKVTDSIRNIDTSVNDGNDNAVKTANVSNIELSGISGNGIIGKGQSVILLDATDAALQQTSYSGTVGLETMFNTSANNTVKVGLVRSADISYEIKDKTIIAKIDDMRINPDDVNLNVKPLAEGRLAALENVTRGSDLLMSVMGEQKPVGTFTPIAAINGVVNKYKSGSHVDTRDYRVIIGSQYQVTENLFFGVTTEYGRSNYDTYNEFASGKVKGDGNTYNYGVSLFSKLQTALDTGNEMYMDGAIRFGRTSTEFQSGDIVMGNGDTAHYKSKVNYYGVNLGTGFIYHINDSSSFDSSIHYLWTRLGSDSIVLDSDNVDFQKMNSTRFQVKEQYNYQSSENIKFTLAGIYEYELDSDSNATVSGVGIDAPRVKGSTGIMELGIVATPLEGNKDLSLNLNVRGYSGKRDGASAAVMVKYDF
ncbi:autotransporter domain-containing protein [Orbus mooreae]|uniref:autotransporter domain-containing protein n=1 Tax=Orbus mooreae TaxID=3074107 RepID=UPI00370D884B